MVGYEFFKLARKVIGKLNQKNKAGYLFYNLPTLPPVYRPFS